MIRRQVSVALLVRDAFTGYPFPSAHGTFCEVDGQRCTPVWKEGGYLVLTDLPPGEHTVTLRRQGYLEESLTAVTGDGRPWEGWMSLRPGADCRLPVQAVRVSLAVSGPQNTEIWLAQDGGGKLKLAQEKAEAGARQLKVFCSGPESRQPVPGDFLIADAKNPETAALESLQNGRACLARPLLYGHARGKELMFAQRYQAGGDGRIECVLRESGKLWVLCGKTLSSWEIMPGENKIKI